MVKEAERGAAEGRLRWRAGMGDADARELVDKIDGLEKANMEKQAISNRLYVGHRHSSVFSEAWLDGVPIEHTDDADHNIEIMEDAAVAVAELFWPLSIQAVWGWHLNGEEAPASCQNGRIVVNASDIIGEID